MLEESSASKVFVKGVPQKMDSKEVIEFFSQFGHIKDCQRKRNYHPKGCFGYTILTFREKASAESLFDRVIQCNELIYECFRLLSKKNLSKHIAQEKRRRLFVSNIGCEISSQDLLSAFCFYPGTSHAYVKLRDDYSQLNKGFGVVVFKDIKSKNNFLNSICSKNIYLKGRKLEVSNNLSDCQKKLFFSDSNNPFSKNIDGDQLGFSTSQTTGNSSNTVIYNHSNLLLNNMKEKKDDIVMAIKNTDSDICKTARKEVQNNTSNFSKSLGEHSHRNRSTKQKVLIYSKFIKSTVDNYRLNREILLPTVTSNVYY